MDKTIRRITSFEDQEAEAYRYWQSQSVGDRLIAVCELSEAAYAFAADFKDLLRAFNTNAVKYLIIGSHALGVHLVPRATRDLDLFIRSDQENAKAVFRALAQFGAPLEG
jgi:hypothetical protein